MAESGTKGLKSLGLNDRDEAIRKTRCFKVISVEGFETCSLQEYALKLTLREHFASCGKVLAVYASKSKRVAFIRILGEDAQEKALALNGTDVGGWCAIVKAAAWPSEPFVGRSERIKECRFGVKGYDTGLPEIDIQIALCKHFSSCGEVTEVTVLHIGVAYITIRGERCLHKALKLSGRDVGGMKLVVDIEISGRENVKRTIRFYRPVGYMPPERRSPLLELEQSSEEHKRFVEKMEKEKEMEMEKEWKEMKRIKMEVMEEEMEEMKAMEKKAL